MCGLAGFLERGGCRSAAELERLAGAMAETLVHRGPDDAGVWVDADAGVALGHRRLAVIDLSPQGHQPMVSACGRYVIVFNGEIYNFPELRRELEGLGHRFRGQSDTEVLLAAIARFGLAEALRRSNGMFALALWDRRERTLSLARDRLGQKPLYYGRAGSGFVFASELKAIRAHPEVSGELDWDALALYLRHGFVPAPYTIYRGVWKLPPGTVLEVPHEGRAFARPPEPRPYWSAVETALEGAASPFAGSDEEAARELDRVLRQAVRACMIADVPLGAFLSGGIDSSTVVALMQAQSGQPVRTFSIGFRERDYDEARHAARVARHLGTDHTEFYLTDTDARAVIPDLADLYDEPFADSSQIPTFLVSRLARREVTVTLSGDGGDELFAGYDRYSWARRLRAVEAAVPLALRRGAARAMRAVPVAHWDAAVGGALRLLPRRFRHMRAGDKVHKLATVLEAATREEIYKRLVSYWQEPGTVVVAGREAATPLNDPARWPPLPTFSEQMALLDAVGYLPDDILVKLDRASMAVSLEARVPYLDHRVVELAWRLPLALKICRGRRKWVLRRVLRRYVPDSLTERPKMGFGVPIGAWLRGPLKEWAEELLSEEGLRRDGFFDPAPIRRVWAEHLSGRRNWQYPLWAILMFQQWKMRWLA